MMLYLTFSSFRLDETLVATYISTRLLLHIYCHTVRFCVSDTQVLNLTISPTEIPSADTTAVSQAFKLPQRMIDGDFYIVGQEPIVVNSDINHHIVLIGCPDEKG